MRKLFICVIVAVGLFAAEAAAADDQSPRLNGVWNVTVAVRNCDTGERIRKVRALNLFVHDIRTIELSQDGTRFTSIGTVEDCDARNVRVSIGCSTETAAGAQQ